LTKLDSDTRGGAALSVFTETGKTILFSTSSEKLDQLDLFYPDRIASRIIGMGDVMTLIEKAEEIASTKEMEEMGKRVLKNEITLEDFLVQLNELKKMGPLNSVLEMLPGKGGLPKIDLRVDDVMLQRCEAIIRSMTQKERRNPSIINSSRKQRIATGSGTQVNDINRLLKQFASLKLILSRVSKQKRGFLKKGLLGL
jgi:signal recognition particle subunit SRP54